jgi:hypothetical protein
MSNPTGPTTPAEMPAWVREIFVRPGAPDPAGRPITLPITLPAVAPEKEKEPA